MNLIEFVKRFQEHNDSYTKVVVEWNWTDEGIDEEYSFEGTPSQFVEKYTEHYDCIDGFDIFDVTELKVVNAGARSEIYIEIVKD